MHLRRLATFVAIVCQVDALAVPTEQNNTVVVEAKEQYDTGVSKGSLVERCGPICLGLVSTAIAVIIGQISPTNIKGGMNSFMQHTDPLRWATVRLYIGLPNGNDKQDPSTGGSLPQITLYDEFGKFWGWGHQDGGIKQGEFVDYEIEGKTRERPAYAKISAGTRGNKNPDAVCISALQVKYPDSGSVIILGDVGDLCGWPWYPSITELDKEEGTAYQPSCMWIDGDNSYNQGLPRTITFHIRDFDGRDNRTTEAYKKYKKQLCEVEPRMSKYMETPERIPFFSPPLRYNENRDPPPNNIDMGYLTDPKNRKISERKPRWLDIFERDLGDIEPEEGPFQNVTTEAASSTVEQSRYASMWVAATGNNPLHSVERLCNTPSTFGPDFANLGEGKYCDMTARKIWPICDDTVDSACFDVDAAALRGDLSNDYITTQSMGASPFPKKNLTQRVDLIGRN